MRTLNERFQEVILRFTTPNPKFSPKMIARIFENEVELYETDKFLNWMEKQSEYQSEGRENVR